MRQHRARLAAGLAGALCALLLLAACGAKGGQPTPEAVASEYVAALKAGDSGRLAKLADPDYDSSAEIKRRLDTTGNGRFNVTDTFIGDTESDHIKVAKLRGTLNGEPYSETLGLHLKGKRWYITFGRRKNVAPE
jgi:hypothetical protein